jgi:pyruvate dehydrogenase E1 component alpha subunit
MAHLRDSDCIASTHRGHGHCIAKGVDGMMAEIYGKKTGVCGGKGGSMHIADLEKGMLGANGIVGAGARWWPAARWRPSSRAATMSVASSATAANEGAVFEAMNLASIMNLPCLFVAENNGYAEATASNWSVACDHIADRAAGFGMPGVTVDGFDFFAVHEAAGAAIERAPARAVADRGQAQPLLRPLRGRCADLPRPGRSEEPARIPRLPDAVPQRDHPRRLLRPSNWTPSTPESRT